GKIYIQICRFLNLRYNLPLSTVICEVFMRKISLIILFIVAVVLAIAPVHAQENVTSAPNPDSFQITEYLYGFSNPIYLTSAGDDSGRLFALEQTGTIQIVKDRVLQDTAFLDIS